VVDKDATPAVFEIPASYSGWVVVEYGDSASPPLSVVDGKRVLPIPPSGFLTTSSSQEVGTQQWEFYRVAADGTRLPVEDVSARWDIGQKAAEMSFGIDVVCCFHTGESTSESGHRTFDTFYVGRGPAGYDLPPWPQKA
jgi:uncharacterized protein DUF6843